MIKKMIEKFSPNFFSKKKISYFDIHSHIHCEESFSKKERKKILKEMKKKNFSTIAIGVDFKDSKKAAKLAQKNKNIFASIGLHPVDNPKEIFEEKKYQEILDKDWKKNKKIVCVGECGLDYFWPSKDLESGKISRENFEEEKKRQKKDFKKQIDFAVKNSLPLMLHVRSFLNSDAHMDAFEILDAKQIEHEKKVRANFHFFTESPEIVNEVIKRGFFISMPGVITFADLDESIRKIPIENLMSETDSPYATPKPYRGHKNNPLNVEHVVKKISEVKKMEIKKCNKILVENAIKFFNIKN